MSRHPAAPIHVGRAAPDFADWTGLHALLQRAFALMEGRIDPPSSLATMGAAALQAKARDEYLLVAHEHSATAARLVGCLFAAVRTDCVYLGKLAVDDAWRGRGIARRLLAAAEAIAREQGKPFLELQTRVELVENHRAFAALGFVKVGESAHPGYTRPTSITMRKPLQA